MAHPDFTDRSFEQIARTAIRRCSQDISKSMQSAFIARAKLKDARAALGAHPLNSRAADRRYVIHMRARTTAALVATAAGLERLSEGYDIPGIIASERVVA